uniref:Uncharacterized protein n=1 Tax=Meloidogyne floridensis TaxID=298350 RepID=A0A915P1V2_9BILA
MATNISNNKLPFPQTLVIMLIVIINYNEVKGMINAAVGNTKNMVPSPVTNNNISGFDNKNLKKPSTVSFNNHPKAAPQKYKISKTKATPSDYHHKIAASPKTVDSHTIEHEMVINPQEEIEIKNEKMEGGNGSVNHHNMGVQAIEENKVNGSNNEQIEKQVEEKVKENKVYSKLIEEIHWNLGYRQPTDQKKKVIETVANLLVPYVEKFSRVEEKVEYAYVAGSIMVKALTIARQINKYKEMVGKRGIETSRYQIQTVASSILRFQALTGNFLGPLYFLSSKDAKW